MTCNPNVRVKPYSTRTDYCYTVLSSLSMSSRNTLYAGDSECYLTLGTLTQY